MKKILLVVFMSLCISAPAFALDGNEMLEKVDRNLNPESYEMYRKLIVIDQKKKKKE
ncbi:MAG: outer membrane lipoprotein-sorting protein, partial [Deltaproteobacteria bacterium]|nr:outer membrane lipoprotein-sorting protein [Deltaproteobacteria bacterium]